MAVSIKHIPTEVLVFTFKYLNFTHIAENCSQVSRQWQGISCQFFIIPYILLMEKLDEDVRIFLRKHCLLESTQPNNELILKLYNKIKAFKGKIYNQLEGIKNTD